jgi:predicted ester cyclase/ketosteroid isomerase-like protein
MHARGRRVPAGKGLLGTWPACARLRPITVDPRSQVARDNMPGSGVSDWDIVTHPREGLRNPPRLPLEVLSREAPEWSLLGASGRPTTMKPMQRGAFWTFSVGALLAACVSSAAGPAPAPAPIDWHAFDIHRVLDAGSAGPTAKERAVVETYTAAIASPGMAQLGPSFDGSVHFAFPGVTDARGRDAVVRAHDSLFGAFASRAVVTHRVWRTESAHAIEWTMSGTQSKLWMGVAATGKQATFKGLTILWTKDEGSITDVHVYFDVAVVKAQLGAGPKELLGLPIPAVRSEPPQTFDQSGSSDETNNMASPRAALDALEQNHLAAYVATMTDDIEVYSLERVQPMRGTEDARAYFRAMHKTIGQLDTTISNIWGIGRFAVVEYEIAGDQIGTLGWISPQRDKVIRLHVVDAVEIRDGKIARVWRYDNPAEITAGI